MHLHLPLLPPLFLALGTWLLYVADRILDGLRPRQAEKVPARRTLFNIFEKGITLWCRAPAAALYLPGEMAFNRLPFSPVRQTRDEVIHFLPFLVFKVRLTCCNAEFATSAASLRPTARSRRPAPADMRCFPG